MAISYIGGLNAAGLIPGYNQVNYYFDSTNKNMTGFAYVADLYLAGTATKIFSTQIAPRFGDGYGEVPLQKVLQAYLSFDLDPTNTTSLAAPNSWYKFDLKMGEAFVTDWSYTSYFQYTGGGTYNNYTMLRQTPGVTGHGFVVGNQITVDQTDLGVVKPMLQGLFTVVAVPDIYTIVLDIPFSSVGTGATMGGKVRYSDNRKTITRNLNTQTATVFNGALSTPEYRVYNAADYKLLGASGTRKLLTSMPASGIRMTRSQDAFVNVGNYYTTLTTYMYFVNNTGDTFRKAITPSAAEALKQVAVGPNNAGTLSIVSGTLPLLKAATKSYTFYVATAAGAAMTKPYTVTVDDRCKIEDKEVLFMDRMGSFLSFAFQARIKESGTITRETYKRALGGLSGGIWTYSNIDAGEVSTAVDVEQEITLTTNWMNEAMSLYFEELLSSPVTLLKVDGVYYSYTVTDTSYQRERIKNKKMIRKTVTMRPANANNINV